MIFLDLLMCGQGLSDMAGTPTMLFLLCLWLAQRNLLCQASREGFQEEGRHFLLSLPIFNLGIAGLPCMSI